MKHRNLATVLALGILTTGLSAQLDDYYHDDYYHHGESSEAAAPTGGTVQVTESNIRTTVLTTAKTQVQATSEESTDTEGTVLGMKTRVGADMFYGSDEFDGGGDVESWGMNLSAVTGETMEFRLTLPLYTSDYGNFDITTMGLDLAGKYHLSENIAVGAHANWIRSDFDGGNDQDTFVVGPFASFDYTFSEKMSLSVGILFDRIDPENADADWLGAIGANLGIAISPNFVLNPYLLYFNNLDHSGFGDDDWWDLGVEGSFSLSNIWHLNGGIKTTLGYDPFDTSYEIYLGTTWVF